jgi:hypothetical protein
LGYGTIPRNSQLYRGKFLHKLIAGVWLRQLQFSIPGTLSGYDPADHLLLRRVFPGRESWVPEDIRIAHKQAEPPWGLLAAMSREDVWRELARAIRRASLCNARRVPALAERPQRAPTGVLIWHRHGSGEAPTGTAHASPALPSGIRSPQGDRLHGADASRRSKRDRSHTPAQLSRGADRNARHDRESDPRPYWKLTEDRP